MDKVMKSSHSTKITLIILVLLYARGMKGNIWICFMFYYFSFSGVNGKSDGDVVYYILNSLLSF